MSLDLLTCILHKEISRWNFSFRVSRVRHAIRSRCPASPSGFATNRHNQAASIALRTVTKTIEKQNVIKEVRFVLFSVPDLKVYLTTIADILGM